MGFLTRLKGILGVKAEKALDKVEDPKEMLDYSLQKMEEGLRSLSQKALEIGTAKKKLENQRDKLQAATSSYEDQAKKALEFGQEDLAKEALIRKMEGYTQLQDIETRIKEVEENLQILAKSKEEMKRKIQTFKVKKEELKAVYSASQAQLKVKEMLTSLGSETDNVGLTIERAEARIEDMRARGEAIDELVDQGLVNEVLEDGRDEIERKLKKLSMDSAVEEELEKLKAMNQTV